jgi:TolA-binding protein
MHVTSGRAAPSRGSARRLVRILAILIPLSLVLASGCAKYNTFYNAEKAFDDAERQREEKLKSGEDVSKVSGDQKQKYQRAIQKAQKILDRYPGNSLTDDALFLQGKSYQRFASYRMSIRKLDLLFVNFPQTPFLEEALFLQAVNYLMLGDASRSQDLLDRLERQYPESRFQSDALQASGDNAYTLEDWEDAITAYHRYLERFPDSENWDDSSIRLGEAYWELERYQEAVPVLQNVLDRSTKADRVFRARMLLARCLVQLGDFEGADALIRVLKMEAEIYQQQGEVQLIEAESLFAQGRDGDAMAMLERMPDDQLTREVKPVRAELLGYAYLEREDLEQAKDYFQEAVTGANLLEEPEVTRRLLGTIRDYLAAVSQLPDADPPRAARLRLLQANSLLFGFDRVHQAYDLYTAVAADTAADSTIAPRALYGAMLVQATYLDNPDSAAFFADELDRRFPDSPQAYEARSGSDSDLLAFLLAQESARLAAQRADAELVASAEDLLGAKPEEERPRGSGLRRRLIYLQRRDPLIYPPPPVARQRLEQRLAQEADARAALAAAAVPAVAAGETLSFDAGDALTDSVAAPTAFPDTTVSRPVPADTLASLPEVVPAPTVSDTTALPPEPEPEEEPKKEKPQRWDF